MKDEHGSMRGLIVAAAAALWLAGCTPTESPTATQANTSGSLLEHALYAEPSAAELAALEEAVRDLGHQPWRLEPLSVSKTELSKRLGRIAEDARARRARQIEADENWRLEQSGAQAKAYWKVSDGRATITLKNSDISPAAKGVWFVTAVEIAM